ncbi:MAG: TolC family protein [Candidatus Zixiibacteriota bacterium]
MKIITTILLLLPAGLSEIAQAEIVITVAEARRRALEFNRTYLAAKEEVTKAQSEIVKARSGALPELSAGGSYSRGLILPSFFVQMDNEVVEFKTGFKNNFDAYLNLRQALWRGGKVMTALSIAKMYKKYSQAEVEAAEALVVQNAEELFYSAVLEKSRLAALQKEMEATCHNLEVIEKKYSQGLVSNFEVLRARVEKFNLEPQLLKAESDVRLAEKRLKSFLGIELNEPILLIDEPPDTSLGNLPPLASLVDTALAKRPEMRSAELLKEITRKAVRIAKSEYYPSLDAVSSYNWQSVSNDFTLSDNITQSWTAGITFSIPIFSGGRTQGEIGKRHAEHLQARLAAQQLRDDIKLEVEEAYDQLLQAKEALSIQRETIAQAEEGLRIANLRYESGVGTLLEVLSAQAALTNARNIEAQALFFFRTALARLKKATTIDINAQ